MTRFNKDPEGLKKLYVVYQQGGKKFLSVKLVDKSFNELGDVFEKFLELNRGSTKILNIALIDTTERRAYWFNRHSNFNKKPILERFYSVPDNALEYFAPIEFSRQALDQELVEDRTKTFDYSTPIMDKLEDFYNVDGTIQPIFPIFDAKNLKNFMYTFCKAHELSPSKLSLFTVDGNFELTSLLFDDGFSPEEVEQFEHFWETMFQSPDIREVLGATVNKLIGNDQEHIFLEKYLIPEPTKPKRQQDPWGGFSDKYDFGSYLKD